MTNTPDRISSTLDYPDWAIAVEPDNPTFPDDIGEGRAIYDITVHRTPERHDWHGYGHDVTITDKTVGWSVSRRYYGIELSDAIQDILDIADAHRTGM